MQGRHNSVSSIPSEDIFDETVNTATRKFLKQAKKTKIWNRRRTEAFEAGLRKETVVFDPNTKAPYRVLMLDLKTKVYVCYELHFYVNNFL